MSDDSFIREVDEELRQDRLSAIWRDYRAYILGAAAFVVLATGGLQGWRYWRDARAAAGGDAFVTAVELSAKGSREAAMQALGEQARSASGGYRTLADLRLAGEMAGGGDLAGALAAFDRIAADASADPAFRSAAALRAGMIATDIEPYDKVKARLDPLAAAGAPWRHLAREMLGNAALKAGADEEAMKLYALVASDAGAGSAARSRVAVMIDLLAGKGVRRPN
jgi:hypothetical protein